MSKIMEAVVQGGAVKVGSLSVPGAVILSEGDADSQGILILESGEKFYITKITPDLKTTIEKTADLIEDLNSALTEIATALTAIAAVPSGWVTPPPTVAANVTQILAKVAELTATRTALNTLKGALK